jgi:hypothetical protein
MDSNIKPNERSLAQEQPSVGGRKTIIWMSDAYKARMNRKNGKDPMTAHMAFQILYVFSFFLLSNLILLRFVRKRCFWLIPKPITTGIAICMFICVTMITGILIVCFTAPKQPGMSF